MLKRKHVKHLREENGVENRDQLGQIDSLGLKTEASTDDGSCRQVGRGELGGMNAIWVTLLSE